MEFNPDTPFMPLLEYLYLENHKPYKRQREREGAIRRLTCIGTTRMGGKRKKDNTSNKKATTALTSTDVGESKTNTSKVGSQIKKGIPSIVSAIAVAFISIIVLKFIVGKSLDSASENGRVTTMSKLYPSTLSEDDLIRAWTEGSDNTHGEIKESFLVERVPLSQMTHEKFYSEYVIPRKPVVIEGAYDDNPLVDPDGDWSFDNIHKKYGHVQLPSYMIPLQAGSNYNCSDAGLCKKYDDKTIGDMFEETFLLPLNERKIRIIRGIPQPYPHDVCLEKVLPDIYHHAYQKLSYFGENLLLGAKKGYDKWPSLFFGPAGSSTGLHVDGMGTSFTMAVFRGIKQFVLFPNISHMRFLCMDAPLQASKYGIDALNPNFSNEYGCPNAKQASPVFATLRPGDILYVPGSTPHAARNLEDSIGIAHNFLTLEDYYSHLESGQFGYDLTLSRNNDRTNNGKIEKSRIELTPEFVAMRDLFLLLKETQYKSDWSQDSLFLHPHESRQMAYDRIVEHLEEKVLENEASAKKYATRVGFLTGNRFAVIALRAAGIWDECLNKYDRETVLMQPHRFPEDETRNRLFALFKRTKGSTECQQKMDDYLSKVESGLVLAAEEISKEKTLSSLHLKRS